MPTTGRLVVILAAEVVGYSSLVEADEESILERLAAHRHQLVFPKIAEHSGRVVRATGPNLLVEFASPTEAVRCAVDVQRGMIDRNVGTASGQRITFRIGVSIGEATAIGEDLVSRAVAALPTDRLATLIKPGTEIYNVSANEAMRVATLANPAGICVSAKVRDAVRDQLPYTFEDIGEQNLDSHAAPAHCYAIDVDSVASRPHVAPQSHGGLARRRSRLRAAAVAATISATVGVWAVAFWSWVDTGSLTAPIPPLMTAAAPLSSVSSTADGGSHALSTPSPPPVSSTTANTEAAARPEAQPSSGGKIGDKGTQVSLAPQPSPAVGAAVVKGSPAPSGVQITPDSGATVVRGRQIPSALQITPDNGTAVVRGNQAPSPPQMTPDSGTAVVRGNQTPSPPQMPPDSGIAVVRGKQASSTLQAAPESATDATRM
jgi:class 3 adenylate cyclase